MICRFNNVINIKCIIFHSDCIGFKNISRLVVGKLASLNVI